VRWHGKELRGAVGWDVWHPEGPDHGMPARRFGSRREAMRRAREYNAQIPGHVVRPVMGESKGGEG
jgi:hypothetical protein